MSDYEKYRRDSLAENPWAQDWEKTHPKRKTRPDMYDKDGNIIYDSNPQDTRPVVPLTRTNSMAEGTSIPLEAMVNPDEYVKSKKVKRLMSCFADDYLKGHDVALVFFYGASMYDGRDVEKTIAKEFIKAAEKTKRARSTFVTADCDDNLRMCQKLGVPHLPYIMSYSRGIPMGNVASPSTVGYKELQRMVEKSPVL